MQAYPSLIALPNFYSLTFIEAEKLRYKVHDFDVKIGSQRSPSSMPNQGIIWHRFIDLDELILMSPVSNGYNHF